MKGCICHFTVVDTTFYIQGDELCNLHKTRESDCPTCPDMKSRTPPKWSRYTIYWRIIYSCDNSIWGVLDQLVTDAGLPSRMTLHPRWPGLAPRRWRSRQLPEQKKQCLQPASQQWGWPCCLQPLQCFSLGWSGLYDGILYSTMWYISWARILVQVTIYRRLLIGRDGHLDQSEAYDIS